MQKLERLIPFFIITALILLPPALATSELHINSDLWLDLSENEDLALRFSGFDSKADTLAGDDYYKADSTSSSEMGYWLEDIPWLGVTADTSLVANNETNAESSVEADTHFDLTNSFILFRLQDGPLQPFVGFGPTLLLSDFAGKNVDPIHNLFMGFHYSF